MRSRFVIFSVFQKSFPRFVSRTSSLPKRRMTSSVSFGIVNCMRSPAFGNLASSTGAAVARRVERRVFELAIRADRAQQQAAAGHVAHAGEHDREAQPLAEKREEDVDVFAAGDGAEEHDLVVLAEGFRQRGDVALERLAVLADA